MKDLDLYFQKRTPLILSLGVPEAKASRLLAYLKQLVQSNEELNLISRKMTAEELVDKHLVDVLLGLKHFPKNIKKVADLGSGGGIPGVVYAILFSDIQFDLYEKSPKKRAYLKNLAQDLSNVHLFDEIPKIFPSHYDLIMARAFKPLDVILDLTRTHLQKSGTYFLFKARAESIEQEIQDSQKKFSKQYELSRIQIIPLATHIDMERNLLVLNYMNN